ncbi:hypothetical protein [Ferruginibacter profundus]
MPTQNLPAAFVSKATVNQRVGNYQNHKLPTLSAALGRSDTKSIWYTVEHLEQLLDELHYQEASGMRVYFGAYPSDHDDYPGQLCLMMVPTTFNGTTSNHEDIIIEEQDDFTDRFGAFDPEEIENIYKSFNFGSPCPPACLNQDPGFPIDQ